MTDNKFMNDVLQEVARARVKFPTNEHKLVAFCEEAGEVANAFLEHKYGKTSVEDVWKECVQAAAMAMRCAVEGDHTFPYQAPYNAPQSTEMLSGGEQECEGFKPTHRHKKRGTDYQVIGQGILQVSGTAYLGDEYEVTIYQGDDGKLWVRGTDEFNDGRFDALSQTIE